MRKLFCDRCGEEMKFAQMNVWIGSRTSDGYEKIDSEVAEQ